nr:MAG: hypothetical protein [Caudoviricetes sp.]
MAANSNMQIVGTDFDQIKNNLINFLKDQNILSDASYTGSVLSTLLDILAYNTHYNAFYTNMVGNEMFLDTATRRSSVISHAKVLGYNPASSTCSKAIVDIEITGLDLAIRSFVMPKYTKFLSEKLDGKNYTFVTTREYFLSNETGNFNILGVELKQGTPLTYRILYNSSNNPETKFRIPEPNIDLDTLEVIVQKSGTDFRVETYSKYDDVLELDPNSKVYFIQESLDNNYEIYFGNNILGKGLDDGNIVILSYLTTSGDVANGIRNFSLIDGPLASYDNLIVTTIQPSFVGSPKESIDSIKYTAPKTYSAQGRAVTKNDYIALLRKASGNKYPIDAVNVWSGEESDPPIFGKVFVAIKPSAGYTLTEAQKRIIKEDFIKPISIVTVDPEIVDVDYTFLKVETDVLVDRSRTLLTDSEIRSRISTDIKNYAANTLNSFDSTLIIPNFVASINALDSSIITNQQKIYLQKKILPELNLSRTYTVDFSAPIKRDIFSKSITISPSIQYLDSIGVVRTEVYIEQSPSESTFIDSIEVLSPGMYYYTIPTVTISGDGTGATARAIVSDGKIKQIVLTDRGKNYTQAVVQITPNENFAGGTNPSYSGMLGSARAIISGRYGTLRSYYYNDNGIKTILNGNIGTIDYEKGIITLNDFSPYEINSSSGVLSLYVIPESTIIESRKNKLLTLDKDDPSSVTVNILSR